MTFKHRTIPANVATAFKVRLLGLVLVALATLKAPPLADNWVAEVWSVTQYFPHFASVGFLEPNEVVHVNVSYLWFRNQQNYEERLRSIKLAAGKKENSILILSS